MAQEKQASPRRATKPPNVGFGHVQLSEAGAKDVQQRIIQICEAVWREQKQGDKDYSDCSLFVREVSSRLANAYGKPQIELSGNANAICKQLEANPPWRLLGIGVAGSLYAGLAASRGEFVVAGTSENPNGHVAVVVGFDFVKHRPVGYWGRLRGQGRKRDSLRESWSPTRKVTDPATGTSVKIKQDLTVYEALVLNIDDLTNNSGSKQTPYDSVTYYATPLI